MISGIRAVLKAERHRHREIPEEEAYFDWKLRLAKERMNQANCQMKGLYEVMKDMLEEWQESEGFWRGETWNKEEEYHKLKTQYEVSEEKWHQSCIEWWKIAKRDYTEGQINLPHSIT